MKSTVQVYDVTADAASGVVSGDCGSRGQVYTMFDPTGHWVIISQTARGIAKAYNALWDAGDRIKIPALYQAYASGRGYYKQYQLHICDVTEFSCEVMPRLLQSTARLIIACRNPAAYRVPKTMATRVICPQASLSVQLAN